MLVQTVAVLTCTQPLTEHHSIPIKATGIWNGRVKNINFESKSVIRAWFEFQLLISSLKEKDRFEYLGVLGRIILKFI